MSKLGLNNSFSVFKIGVLHIERQAARLVWSSGFYGTFIGIFWLKNIFIYASLLRKNLFISPLYSHILFPYHHMITLDFWHKSWDYVGKHLVQIGGATPFSTLFSTFPFFSNFRSSSCYPNSWSLLTNTHPMARVDWSHYVGFQASTSNGKLESLSCSV